MEKRWLPWVLPMALFLAANVAEGRLPRDLYPAVYLAKVVVVAAALIWASPAWRARLRWETRPALLGIAAGVVGIVLWIAVERFIPYPHIGSREAYDPFREIAQPALRTVFVIGRFLGLAALVPVMEEVFWRGFGLRYATDQDRWADLPLDKFSLAAAGIVSAVFAFVHPEWLSGALYAVGIAALLKKTGSLLACVLAHGVTNLLLGVWVVTQRDWALW